LRARAEKTITALSAVQLVIKKMPCLRVNPQARHLSF
jgi:hypothetical protein